MRLNEYQDLASRTAKFPEQSYEGYTYTALGLNGESGEVAELIKKMIRDDRGVMLPERRDKLKKELGDVLWYLSQLARVAGFTLEEIAESNVAKLASRADRGQIHGDGDER